VPDNLKTGVDKPSRPEPKINKTYHEMAEHYGTAVIPARVRRPKDKPNAEGAVGVISTWIIASLRHQQFFSLQELNGAIREKLAELTGKQEECFFRRGKSVLAAASCLPIRNSHLVNGIRTV
jgi:transposase